MLKQYIYIFQIFTNFFFSFLLYIYIIIHSGDTDPYNVLYIYLILGN